MREADHERLQKAFTGIDFDETMSIADEERHAQTQATPTSPLKASCASLPLPGPPAPPSEP